VSKTPSQDNIIECSKWLFEEIKVLDCKVALALGNTPLIALKGVSGGILKLSGTSETIPIGDYLGLEVCWSVHPAYVLRGGTGAMEKFREAIDNFMTTFEDRLKDIPF
jgi:uracil-DNA glycosylase